MRAQSERMRLSQSVDLALLATVLPNVYAAAANPATSYVQEYRPLSTTGPYAPTWDLRSQWRSLSGKVIEAIWGPKPCHEAPTQGKQKKKDSKKAQDEHRLPTHTVAQYGGDVVLRFNISTAEEVTSFAEAADTLLLDVWEFTEDWVDVRLAMELVPSLLGLLPESLRHAHKPLLKERDLAQAIFETYPAPKEEGESRSTEHQQLRPFGPALQPGGAHRATGAETNIFFTDYQPLSVITPWLRLMSSLFTTHVRPVTVGTSAEGRPITGLRIGVHPTNDDDKDATTRKTVLITAGLHAREWISTSTALYIAYNLITGYGKNSDITKLLEDFDFVIVPTLNPDGYTYTWTTDRLWRKTRQNTPVSFCPGIDLDHAFGFAWSGAADSGGNPCSEAYAGTQAFGATEAEALASWAKNETKDNNAEFVGFLDLHSYSQQILYPYSYSCRPSPPGLEDLEELGYGLMKAIRLAHGHGYEVLPACEGNTALASSKQDKQVLPAVETRGGSALDWFYHELKVRWAYQIKLRDRGMYGFLLPKEHIVPTGKEILEAVMYFGGFLQDVYIAGSKPSKNAVLKEEENAAVDAEEVNQGNENMQALLGSYKQVEDDEEAWVMVEDLSEEPKWDLKRRRRR